MLGKRKLDVIVVCERKVKSRANVLLGEVNDRVSSVQGRTARGIGLLL